MPSSRETPGPSPHPGGNLGSQIITGARAKGITATVGEERTSDTVLDQALASHDMTLEGTTNVQSEKGLIDFSPSVSPGLPCQIILHCHRQG